MAAVDMDTQEAGASFPCRAPCAFRVSPTERGDHFSFQKELPFSKDSAAQSSSATVKVGFTLGRGSPVYQKIGGRSSAKNNKFHVDGCVP